MSYIVDRRYSDQFIPYLKAIVGPLLLGVTPHEQDTQEAADLVVLHASGRTIACRVRRPGYADRYPYDFTIRAARDTGAKTEITKIQYEGFGDWMVYGHDAGDGRSLSRWYVLNLDVFRSHPVTGALKPNGDGTWFRAYDVRSFPSEFIVASSHL